MIRIGSGVVVVRRSGLLTKCTISTSQANVTTANMIPVFMLVIIYDTPTILTPSQVLSEESFE